jgi:predicted transcriptional regulator of viral defense system
MTVGLLLKKLRIDGREFITAGELKGYCKPLDLDSTAAVRYLLRHGHIVRIFRGIFYVKTLDEEELGKIRYSSYELVAKGLELKGVEHWYFGLSTALKLNNMTHEHFTVDYVVTDTLFRSEPISIAGYEFKFVKLLPKLLGFGVVHNGIRYSDPEKTILDLIYKWRYNGAPREKILQDVKGYTANLSRERLHEYAENYPKTVRGIVEALP